MFEYKERILRHFERNADTNMKKAGQGQAASNPHFPVYTLSTQSEFEHQILSTFLKMFSSIFLPPLELPKWQRSKHIKNHARV